jgi:hypothetical protein
MAVPAIPPNLASPCDEGPEIEAVDLTLAKALEIWRQREAAAADCRARHRALVAAWPQP